MDLGLTGKVAAVAAASRGLGFAVARELAREGAAVSLCSRHRADAERAAASIAEGLQREGREPPPLVGLAADLDSAAGVTAFLERTVSALGEVQILVANNGGPAPGPAHEADEKAWRAGFERTFLSSQRLVEGVLPAMRSARWGRIIFITSISVKQPIEGLAVSTAMRSAVTGYAKALSDELAAAGITVNSVAPGSTRTERLESLLADRAEREGISQSAMEEKLETTIPAARFGRPEEFSAAVAFLASERASYITGTVLPVDGGAVRSLT